MENPKTTKNAGNNWSFELFLRKIFKRVIDPIADFLIRIGITANAITLFGLGLYIGAAILVGFGKIIPAGLVLLVAGPLDVIDGTMARKQGVISKFGAFLDSVIDRYAELFIFGGLIIFFLFSVSAMGVILSFIAAAGSVMVSYTKARAESLGYSAKVGMLSRVERLIIMIFFLVIGQPMIALWIIAILANVTAVQRIIYVYNQTQKQ